MFDDVPTVLADVLAGAVVLLTGAVVVLRVASWIASGSLVVAMLVVGGGVDERR